MSTAPPPILLTGATGHVGGALLERLLADGRRVRCLARDASQLPAARAGVEVVEADLRDREAVTAAMERGAVAYFLVHALSGGGSLADEERLLAENFAAAAAAAGAGRIVYLGGLVDEDDPDHSPHMASRLEVGRILAGSGVPTVELRASIVLGAGSSSFELIRDAIDWLPLIVLPDWADNLAQPIALADVVSYLAAAADVELDGSAVFEIGGADRISYRGLIEECARQLGSGRRTVSLPVPDAVLTTAATLAGPALDRLPGRAREALKLLESLRHTTVVRDGGAAERFGIEPLGTRDAIRAALAAEA